MLGWSSLRALFPDGICAEFARPCSECVRAGDPVMMTMLRRLAPPSNLLFGADYSCFDVARLLGLFRRLDLPEATRRMIKRGDGAAPPPRWNI